MPSTAPSRVRPPGGHPPSTRWLSVQLKSPRDLRASRFPGRFAVCDGRRETIGGAHQAGRGYANNFFCGAKVCSILFRRSNNPHFSSGASAAAARKPSAGVFSYFKCRLTKQMQCWRRSRRANRWFETEMTHCVLRQIATYGATAVCIVVYTNLPCRFVRNAR